MRKILLAAASIAALAFVGPATAQSPIVIKFSHVVATNTPKGLAASPGSPNPPGFPTHSANASRLKSAASSRVAASASAAIVPLQPIFRQPSSQLTNVWA